MGDEWVDKCKHPYGWFNGKYVCIPDGWRIIKSVNVRSGWRNDILMQDGWRIDTWM